MAQSLRPLIDRVLNGQLETRLRAERDAGASYESIARALIAEDIHVSGELIRKWCIELGIEEAA